MAQKSTAAAAVAVAVAVASFQMVGGKCLIPWRAPPCVGRGRRIISYYIILYYFILYSTFDSQSFLRNDPVKASNSDIG